MPFDLGSYILLAKLAAVVIGAGTLFYFGYRFRNKTAQIEIANCEDQINKLTNALVSYQRTIKVLEAKMATMQEIDKRKEEQKGREKKVNESSPTEITTQLNDMFGKPKL